MSTQEKKPEEKDPIQSEEESFFNQAAPPEKEKVKLTKDSILALYGNTPRNPTFNSAYQNSTVYPQNFTYPGIVPQTYPVGAVPATQQPFVGNPPQWVGTAPQYQFAPAIAYQYATPATVQPVQSAGFATPNPFGGIPATAAVQQQFASLNLGAPAPATNTAPTVATNLWQ